MANACELLVNPSVWVEVYDKSGTKDGLRQERQDIPRHVCSATIEPARLARSYKVIIVATIMTIRAAVKYSLRCRCLDRCRSQPASDDCLCLRRLRFLGIR